MLRQVVPGNSLLPEVSALRKTSRTWLSELISEDEVTYLLTCPRRFPIWLTACRSRQLYHPCWKMRLRVPRRLAGGGAQGVLICSVLALALVGPTSHLCNGPILPISHCPGIKCCSFQAFCMAMVSETIAGVGDNYLPAIERA